MSEPVESIELSTQDIEDLEALGIKPDGQEIEYHTILEVWESVLGNAPEAAKGKVTPQWAMKIISEYPQIKFADMKEMHRRYFDMHIRLGEILSEVIAKNPKAKSFTNAAEDIENNKPLYIQLLTEWQKAILGWELDWDCEDPHAAVELAAIAEVHKFFFGPVGITGHLDAIKFEFTQDDQEALQAELEELKEQREVDGE